MTTTEITVANLRLADGKSVWIEIEEHCILARGYARFPLKFISSPDPLLGNDHFTEVFFTTSSGNLYRIWHEETVGFAGQWLMTDVRSARQRADKAVTPYQFSHREIDAAVLDTGEMFRYGEDSYTSPLVAILAVNANRHYRKDPERYVYTTDIRNEFLRLIA